MRGIGGNQRATLQVKVDAAVNAIGETVPVWVDVQNLRGWLDLSSGSSDYQKYSAKMQESTHVFIADFVKLDKRITAETSRALIGGQTYDITLIDNPMGTGKGSQLEIYLKYTGGQRHAV